MKSIRTELLERIFSCSASMVGACMVGISLFQIIGAIGRLSTFADDLLAVDGLIFLLSCFTSFWALRTSHPTFAIKMERVADTLFLVGLTLMVAIGGLLVYAVAKGSVPAA